MQKAKKCEWISSVPQSKWLVPISRLEGEQIGGLAQVCFSKSAKCEKRDNHEKLVDRQQHYQYLLINIIAFIIHSFTVGIFK
jgi:hypothetical protein